MNRENGHLKPVYLVNPELVLRYEGGATLNELAEIFEGGAYKIRSALLKAGVAMRPRGVKGARDQKREDHICRLFRDGMNYVDIGIIVGVSQQRIHQIVSRNGLRRYKQRAQ